MPFENVFCCAEDIVEWVKEMSQNQKNFAVLLWPTEQLEKPQEPGRLNAYIQDNHICCGVKGEWWKIIEDFFQAILHKVEQIELYRFESCSLRPADSANGKKIATKVFSTLIEGVLIQVFHLEEWWQSFGGAHIGDNKRIVLVNHEPLKLADV